MISSSFFGVLTPGQSFWNDAKIVDRRFPVMSPGKKSDFVGLILSLSVLSASTNFLRSFGNHHLNVHRQGTISLFSTPNCQSDPEWNPKTKLETRDLFAGSLLKV